MGKYLTSLLILAASLLLPDEIFADEQVRRVQEELRKRHLFYANPNGEKGPALTSAVRRYQLKKGFPATGVIDPVTLASLGLSKGVPSVATTPVAVRQRGQVFGANGERLPNYPTSLSDLQVSKFDPAFQSLDYLELNLADFRSRQAPAFGFRAPRPISPTLDTQSFDAVAQPAWDTLALPPPAEGPIEPDIVDAKRPRFTAARADRRSQRRPRSVRPRQEKNPIILTYQSVNRAIRSLFGDDQSRKRRSAGKRL